MTNRKWVTLISLLIRSQYFSDSEWQSLLSSMGISSQPTIWKSGSKLIMYFFQAISHILSNREWAVALFSASEAYRITLLTKREWAIFSLPGSLIMSHPMTTSGWVAAHWIHSHDVLSHSMTNRQWVALLLSFKLPGNHINHVSLFHDQQRVSDTVLFLCLAVSWIMSHLRTIRDLWVTLLYFFARQSHQSCLVLTNRKWVTQLVSLPGSHVSSHDQQGVSDTGTIFFLWQASHQSCLSHDQQDVSDTALFLCQAVSSILCLIPWPTGCKWHCLISLPDSLINHCVSSHDQQKLVSDTALFLCQKVASIMSCPMTNSMWVVLLHFFARQSCLVPCQPSGSEWHCFISLPGSLINHVSCHDIR